MNRKLRLAISTCPNDTFAFHAILEKKIDLRGIEFSIELLDIEQLNEGLFEGRFDIAKGSFHAAALLADRTVVLPSGAALGFGVGPLLLSKSAGMSPLDPISSPITEPALPATTENPDRVWRVLCPGANTTATMLFKMFYSDAANVDVQQCLFSDIMPALQNDAADFGVCIHEGRFTWQDHNLGCVEDLGSRWERETESPLPLGGILVSRTLVDQSEDLVAAVEDVIQASIKYAIDHPQEALVTMRKYAQEFDDDVLMKHVHLYVNDWTVELGDVGRSALSTLSKKAKQAGIVASTIGDIEVWSRRS